MSEVKLRDFDDPTQFRIPRLSEFVTGFHYWVYSEGHFEDCVEDFCGWYEYNYNQDNCWRDHDVIAQELENGSIRVEL